jgi:hypothetical protein
MRRGLPRYEKKCAAIAEDCGLRRELNCVALKECHQVGDSILTAYSAANSAMSMALLTVASIEMLQETLKKAKGKEALAIEQERDQLIIVATKQLKNAQRQAARVVDELQRAGVL